MHYHGNSLHQSRFIISYTYCKSDKCILSWYDCETNIIEGATLQSFSPNDFISYYVTITTDKCKVFSECINHFAKSTFNMQGKEIAISPNPTDSVFTINTEGMEISLIRVIDSNSNEIKRSNSNSSSTVLDLQDYPTGLYFIKILSGSSEPTFKLSKY